MAGSNGYIIDSIGTKLPIPHFSADFEAALLTWPSKNRPTNFNGNAIACCIAGLTAHRAILAGQISLCRRELSKLASATAQ